MACSGPIEQNADHGTARKPLILGLNPQLSIEISTVCGRSLSGGNFGLRRFAEVTYKVLILIVFLLVRQSRIGSDTRAVQNSKS